MGVQISPLYPKNIVKQCGPYFINLIYSTNTYQAQTLLGASDMTANTACLLTSGNSQ